MSCEYLSILKVIALGIWVIVFLAIVGIILKAGQLLTGK